MSPKTLQLLRDDLVTYRDADIPRSRDAAIAHLITLGLPLKRARRVWEARREREDTVPDPGTPASREVFGKGPAGEDNPAPNAGTKCSVRDTPEGPVVEATYSLPPSDHGAGVVRNLDELLDEAQIDREKWWADDFQVRTWATPMKRRVGKSHEIVVVRSWYVSAKLHRRLDILTGPADWGATLKRAPQALPDVETVLFVPDMHVGYRWANNHQRLVSLHDWDAVDVMLQVAELVNPDHVVFLGDDLDNAAFSEKFAVDLALRDTARPSLLTMHGILRTVRTLLPHANVTVLEGNHGIRTRRGHIGSEWDGLTAVGAKAPLNHMAHQLGLEALDVEWLDYPKTLHLHNVDVRHGDGATGSDALVKAIKTAERSLVQGHIHRCALSSRTIHGPRGHRTITAMSPGTLGKLDDSLPGANRSDWQQGLGLMRVDRMSGQEFPELLHIHNGVTHCMGRRIVGDGERLARELGQQIGWPQVAA